VKDEEKFNRLKEILSNPNSDMVASAWMQEKMEIFTTIRNSGKKPAEILAGDEIFAGDDFSESVSDGDSDDDDIFTGPTDNELITEFKPGGTVDEATIEKIQKNVKDTGDRSDNKTGSSGLSGAGCDGTLNNKTNRLIISHTYEPTTGIGIDYGSGNGYTTLVLAGATNWKMLGLEHNIDRFQKALKTQKLLLNHLNTAADTVIKNANYANVRFYTNTPYITEVMERLDKSTRDTLIELTKIPVEKFKNQIGLVYWFQSGWNTADKLEKLAEINEFNNLKYFVTDVKRSYLQSNCSQLYSRLSKSQQFNGTMVGQKSSRKMYFYTFNISNLPEIPVDTEFEPISVETIARLTEAVERYREKEMDTRHSRTKLKPYQVTELTVHSTSSKRKRSAAEKPIGKRKAPAAKESFNWDKIKIAIESKAIDTLWFPETCKTITSKLKYVSKTNYGTNLSKRSDTTAEIKDEIKNLKTLIGGTSLYSKTNILDKLSDIEKLLSNAHQVQIYFIRMRITSAF